MYNFANKVVEFEWLNVQRNGFVGNNSRMSTDRPKPASRPIRPKIRTVYDKVL